DKHDTEPSNNNKILILGSGPYCIGSSVEFDWCCVNAAKTAEAEGYESIMLNYNPETVSTDYDTCSKLYFDELSLERVLDIYEFENSVKEAETSVIISTGGQIPNNLALKLNKNRVKILGTDASNIDRAEDRHKFSEMCDKLEIDQPNWKQLSSIEDIYKFIEENDYPVLVRPSYVLSGAAMSVAYDKESLDVFLGKAAVISKEAPVVVSKFEVGAKEIEIDAVAHKGEVVIYAISEHIENAGVHSGDATIVLPPQKLYIETIRRIKVIAKKIAKELNISGPFNMQFLAKNNRVMVIECNLRSSRSFPFSSKITGYNFIELAVSSMIKDTLGKISKSAQEKLDFKNYKTIDLDYVGVKAPQFSFPRLKGADPVLGVEMASTGEVGCLGEDLHEAFLKSMLSVGFEIPKKGILFSIGGVDNKADLIDTAEKFLKLGFKLYATEGTADFFNEHNLKTKKLYKISNKKSPNLIDAMNEKDFDMIVNIPKNISASSVTDGYLIRRKSIDLNIPLITNVQVAKIMAEALEKYSSENLLIKSLDEYYA
ncbi:ATP-grasp domain-containing protein, partial [Candidatus Peregrinibacteria bacterium]|nr:ATP-grasp domain-containing protein [Candidatus Peregrinibacteria bacterium]